MERKQVTIRVTLRMPEKLSLFIERQALKEGRPKNQAMLNEVIKHFKRVQDSGNSMTPFSSS
jgi:hypothetical protein